MNTFTGNDHETGAVGETKRRTDVSQIRAECWRALRVDRIKDQRWPFQAGEEPKALSWKIRGDSFRALKGEGDVNSARRRFQVFSPASRDHHILPAIDLVGDGGGIAGKRKRGLPQQFSCGLVKGAKLLVVVGSADE